MKNNCLFTAEKWDEESTNEYTARLEKKQEINREEMIVSNKQKYRKNVGRRVSQYQVNMPYENICW